MSAKNGEEMMKCFNQFTDISSYPHIVVALGTFDGLHVGHQMIIGHAIELAKQCGGTSVVFTFSNHPLSMIAPERCPLLLMSEKEKEQLLAAMGLDILLSIPFTDDFLHLSPEAFVEALVANLKPAHIVVGPNYTFGYKGKGTSAMLKKAGQAYGFETHVATEVTIDGKMASSTLIRRYIGAGDVEKAAVYLGRPFSLGGVVIHGDARGRQLGFPTANIAISSGMAAPTDGVYAVKVIVGGLTYDGVANMGLNPTFGGKEHRLEVYIFDFTGMLYDQEIKVIFYSRIRGEVKFHNPQELAAQIAMDVEQVRQIFRP